MAESPRHDPYDATFARDLAWAQQLREQLDRLPTTDDDEEIENG